MNKLLTRQIKRHFGSLENLPVEIKGILNDINNTYESFEDDTLLLQNSIEISSQELRNAYGKHKKDSETQKETLNKIKEAISVISPVTQNAITESETATSDSSSMFDSLIRLIEDRKQSEEALMESETRFRLMSDTAPVLIWMSGTDTLCDFFNQTWLDFTGRTLEQEIGNGWTEGVHSEDLKACIDTYLDAFNARRKFRMEYRLRHTDGEYRWLLDNGVPRFTPEGIFIGYIGTCVDITENKLVEETMRNLSHAVEQSPVSIVITDIKGQIKYCNPTVFNLTGYEPEELLGENARIFGSGEKDTKEYAELWKTISSGNEWKGEFHNKKKSGELYWETASISAVKNPKGEIVNYLAVKEDITERKRTEDTLQNERALFRTIIDLIPDAIYVKDVQGRKIIANPKEVQLVGLKSEDEMLNKTDFDLYPSDQAIRNNEEDQHVLQTGKPILNYEGEITDQEGIVHSLLGSKVPLFDASGKITGIVGVSHDITPRKQAEDALQAAHKSLSNILQAAIHTSIISTDIHGVITVFSKGSERMLGYTAEEIIGKTTPLRFHLESELIERGLELTNELGMSVSGFELFVAKARIQEHEERTWTYIHRNGNRIHVNLIVTAIRDKNDEITGFLGVATDISKRIEAEEALLESSKKWEAIISSSPDGIGIVSLDGNLEFMSEKLANIYGYSIDQKDEYIGKPISNFIDPSNHQMLTDNFRNLLLGTGENRITEYMGIKKDSSRFYADVNSTVLFDSAGSPVNILFIQRDITERKLVEAELEENREKYRALTEAAFEAIFISEKGLCIEQNQAAEQMFGFTSEEAMTMHITDFIAPDNREMVMKNKLSGLEEPYEAVALRKDGTTFPCVLRGRMMHYKGRDVRVTSLADISLLKKAEKELIVAKEIAEDSEQKFRSIIQSQAEGIGFVNQNEVFEFANTASERIFETEENELVGTCLYDFLKPDEIKKVDQQTRNRGVGYVNSYELQITTKKGNAKYIYITATPKLDTNDNYLGAYGVFQDITDRKKAEDELKRVSSRLEMATLAGGIGVWEFDVVSNTLLWDDQMYVLYGVKRNNFTSMYQTWQSGLHPSDAMRADAEFRMALRGEKDFNTEFQVCWPDGSVHNIRALANVQCDNSGNPLRMIGTNWDITEQKKTEAVLLKARQDAERANKSKSTFLANMSHEIRTPLNAIIGFSQLLNRDTQLTISQREYNVSIIRAGEHLLSLINDILELSKMEAGHLELNPVNIDLNALLNGIHMIFKESAHSKHLQFIFETAAGMPQYIIVDDNKLRRILINLIGNAIKFTHEGGVAFRARVDYADQKKCRLIVEIQDSGPGIQENEIDSLFKHFVQTSSGINQSTGSGLGLALSRELAILMGGDISVSSEFGKGSVFTVNVEIEIGNAESVQNVIGKRVLGFEKTKKTYRILVADDIEENLQVIVNLLNMVGFETMEAVNGIDVIEIFKSWNPDLILMDIRMPEIDGYEATRRIRATEKGKHIPIIALTASSFEDERKKILEQGMQGHIRKPFRESDLFATIGNILGIQYIYENEILLDQVSLIDDIGFAEEISKLPGDLVSKMQNAVAAADLDLLIKLIQKIDADQSDLSRHLMVLAHNFDFNYLKKILNKRRSDNG
jgi:PAS domain S-box-containing protein